MTGADNITLRSEGPLAGCATATAKTFGSRSFAGRWDRRPTWVAPGNAAGRLPGGKPDDREGQVRFGKGEQETGRSHRACSLLHHAIAEPKQWRSLQRYIGRREYFEETFLAIAGLVSDRTALR